MLSSLELNAAVHVGPTGPSEDRCDPNVITPAEIARVGPIACVALVQASRRLSPPAAQNVDFSCAPARISPIAT
jgi:hypothetical protein